MEADGAKTRSVSIAGSLSSGSKTVVAMRKEAERLIARADAAEAREILSNARAHLKELERETIALGKAMAVNSKACDKARNILMRLEGPGGA